MSKKGYYDFDLNSLAAIQEGTTKLLSGSCTDATEMELSIHENVFVVELLPQDTASSLFEFMIAVADLPNITELRISRALAAESNNTDNTDNTDDTDAAPFIHFPLRALFPLLQNPTKLKSLELEKVWPIGDEYDLTYLTAILKHHRALKVFILDGGAFLYDGREILDSSMSLMEPFLEGLSYVKSMERISLYGAVLPGNLDPSTIKRIGQLPYLKDLNLTSCELPSSSIETLCSALCQNNNTEVLYLQVASLDSSSCQQIMDLVMGENMNTLGLGFDWLDDSHYNMRAETSYIKDIAQALGRSKLETFHVWFEKEMESIWCEHLRAAICTNFSLTKIFLHMQGGSCCDPEISFLTAANELGRGSLFQGTLSDDQNTRATRWGELFVAARKEFDNRTKANSSNNDNNNNAGTIKGDHHLVNHYCHLLRAAPSELFELMKLSVPVTLRETNNRIQAIENRHKHQLEDLRDHNKKAIEELEERHKHAIKDMEERNRKALEDQKRELLALFGINQHKQVRLEEETEDTDEGE